MSEKKWIALVWPRIALALLRGVMVLFSVAVILAVVLGVTLLVGVWAMLTLGKDDLTISSKIIPAWPVGYPIDLLYEFAWGYLLGAVALLFIALPFLLAVFEKFTLLFRWRGTENNGDTESLS